MKAIFYRPNTDIELIINLNVSELVCIDTLPRAEFDINIYNKKSYNKNFIGILLNKCIKLNFTLTKTIELDNIFEEKYANPTLFIFDNKETNKRIKYYISTNIEYNICDILENDIETSKIFIVKTLLPEIEIYDYFKTPKILYTFNKLFCDIIKKQDKYKNNFNSYLVL